MPDYGEILRFLAQNPPKLDAERRVHASLLELLGACMRDSASVATPLIENDAFEEPMAVRTDPPIH